MRRELSIGRGLMLPIQWMTMSSVVYGTRGSGKSTLGRKLAEEVAAHGQRFCAIDPTGAWWGLKSTESGADVGLPVIIFGGDHADVPLEPGSGEEIANIVSEIDQSVIVDLEHLSKGKQIKFLGAFLARLYHVNRDPLLLLMDEAQRYAPQQPQGVDASITLGAAEDIVKLGRKHGLGPVVFTQRGSGLNKEVSELADVLIAFRTPGVLDQKRIKEWLEANATEAQMKEVMATVSGLPTGTAIFASNHPDLKIFGTIAIDRPKTFDSSATPQVGQRRREPRILSKPDIEALRGKMDAAIERAKAEDPKELRHRIAELQKQLTETLRIQQTEKVVETVRTVEVEVAAISEEDWQRLDSLAQLFADGLNATAEFAKTIQYAVSKGDRHPARNPRPVSQQQEQTKQVERSDGLFAASEALKRTPAAGVVHEWTPDRLDDIKLGKPELAILSALGVHQDGLNTKRLSVVTGYSSKSSGFGIALANLRREGLVERGPVAKITEKGLGFVPDHIELPPSSGPELIEYWLRKLSKPEANVLRVMVEAHPQRLSMEQIAMLAGYSVKSSGLGIAIAGLRRMKFVDGFEVSEDIVGRY